MSSHRPLRPSPSPRRASQVPRLVCPRALSPFTPGGPMAAYARSFTIGGGLTALHSCNEAKSGCVARISNETCK